MPTQQLTSPGSRNTKTQWDNQDRTTPSLVSHLSTEETITAACIMESDVIIPPCCPLMWQVIVHWIDQHLWSIRGSGWKTWAHSVILAYGCCRFLTTHSTGCRNHCGLAIRYSAPRLPLDEVYSLSPFILWHGFLLLLLYLSVLFPRRKKVYRKVCGLGGRPEIMEGVRHRKPFH